MITFAAFGEQRLIEAIRARTDATYADWDRSQLPVANGDDGAVWLPRGPIVATVDSIVAGVDWLEGPTPPAAIGHRAAAVNLSDLAAMGARPGVLLLALELPGDTDIEELLESIDGFTALAKAHGAAIVGGDVGLSPGPARWTVTALGWLPGPALRRDQARPGDRLWLIGAVGLAAAGLAALRHGKAPCSPWDVPIRHHLWPEPLLAASGLLAACGARLAAVDVSDGLQRDATSLAKASGVALALRLSCPAAWPADLLDHAREIDIDWRLACAHGGDDYALLVAGPADFDVRNCLASIDIAVTELGTALSGPPGEVTLYVGDRLMHAGGFVHGGAALHDPASPP